MKLDDILSVSGLPGLYRLVTSRSNGLIIEDVDNGKRRFITLRKHQIIPLESVGLYTYTDVANLKEVFTAMQTRADEIPEAGGSGEAIHEFFREIIPEFDEDRVHLSDMKKVIKWYGFLNERGLLVASEGDEEE